MGVFLRKYNTATAAATHISIPIPKRGVVDNAVSADWTPASGDVKVTKDGDYANTANITTLPTAKTHGNTALWEFQFSATELSCKKLEVTISDSATKAVEDQTFIIETFGNASAMYPPDFTDAVRLGLTALPNSNNLNLVFNTDFATVYDTTNKAFLSKLGNFSMGGSSLALSLGSLSNAGTTTLTGAVTATNASNDLRGILLQATQTGVTIPTVTTLTNAPSDSSGVTTLLSRVPSGIFTGITSLAQWLGLIAGKQTGNSTARTEIRATGAGSGTFDETTDSIEALRDRGDAAWITATSVTVSDKTGFRLSATGVDDIWDEAMSGHQTAGTMGLAMNELDTIYTNAYDGITARMLANITHISSSTPSSQIASACTTSITTALTEGYRGTGATGSVRDLLYEIIAHMGEHTISSTTKTLKKIDGSTTAKTYTLNDATNPTGITETT